MSSNIHGYSHQFQVDGFDEYQDYFDYARSALDMEMPSDWQEADTLYRRLVEVSENGAKNIII